MLLNEWIKGGLLAVIGVCSGLLVSGGVFTVILSVGLVPRFAGKTHTGDRIFLYEEMVVLGTLAGNFLSVFGYSGHLSRKLYEIFPAAGGVWQMLTGCLTVMFGLFAGIFVGCLALAIAEMLDTIPIFARRTGFRHGLGIAVLSVALGKLAGSLYYFLGGFAGH
ncbi:MAG TPA: stage V sporulation protein AB [Candidatus Eisenbergiella merdipullorum]|uniref:Stage V sporulation protein AB n=1 Tax=Candidatus Eisenbergiella merdipullorum TaxID=2838553 RepID=A0A9D2KZC6_9FIRM|nr:stage V sporulation protein AB [Candidatus Eisenbergiella merdipullorum]